MKTTIMEGLAAFADKPVTEWLLSAGEGFEHVAVSPGVDFLIREGNARWLPQLIASSQNSREIRRHYGQTWQLTSGDIGAPATLSCYPENNPDCELIQQVPLSHFAHTVLEFNVQLKHSPPFLIRIKLSNEKS